ncbi:exported hypothetical protein [uncultured spirochete]|uniref:Uncharacterized protein n=1 Tax=uncultured spirochete TaxID=156406 RepID=A0A3P3XL30_9SPIR|nr:exported hypothetical protein [uncultured spirochete]
MDKIRPYLLAGLCGLLLGAGIVGGCWIYRAGNDAATNRAVISAYQSAMADWQRRATELAATLDDVRRDARQSVELAGRINAVVTGYFSDIAKARTENELAVEQLRLAIDIYNVLRGFYDKGFNATPKTGATAKP